jgi:aminopeptidase N
MQIRHILFLTLLPFLASAQKTFTGEGKEFEQLVESEKRQFKSMERSPTDAQQDYYDLRYCRFEWDVDPAIRAISGKVTYHFVPIVAGQSSMRFSLADTMHIDQILYHNQPLTYVKSGSYDLDVNLPAPIALGALDSLSIQYHGVPPSTGFGSFNAETHSANLTPVLWTLSEPYGARDWWPTKQSLNDKIDSIDILVRTPEQYKVASNGVLKSHDISDPGHKIWHWKHHHPIPAYLICMAVTDYENFDQNVALPNGVDTLRIHHYIYPEALDLAMSQCVKLPDIIRLYDTLYGVYAFADEKYGFAEFNWGGGMEHTTMTFVINWGYLLQSHETAHQWFGDKITCGSWEDIWLNEGFATYSEGLNYYFGLGDRNFHDWLQEKVNSITSQPGGSVWVDDTSSVNRIFDGRLTYNKGAMLLQMLRWKLGNQDFFQALRNYVKDPALAYGYAKTYQLKAHLEQQSGKDLTEFFNHWFYGQGYPSYHLHWSQNGSTVTMQINQTTSHPSVAFFPMPVEIQFRNQGTLQQTNLVFDHTFDGQQFTFDLPFQADTVLFDPNLNMISNNNSADQLVPTSEPTGSYGPIRIVPNPASDNILLHLPQYTPGESVQVVLSDMLGRPLITRNQIADNLTLDVHNLPQGIYAISVATSNGKMAGTFIKE